MTDETRTDSPDPDAIYEVVSGFVSGRVLGHETFSARTGDRFNGSDPVVAEHFRDGFFRLAPDDVIRRQQAEILAALNAEGRRTQAAKSGPPPGIGPSVARIVDLLTEWAGSWPPTQPEFVHDSELGVGDRRLRQVLREEHTSWAAVIKAAERNR